MSVLGGDGHDHYPVSLLASKWDYKSTDITGFSLAYARFTDDPRQQGMRARGDFTLLGQCVLGKNMPAAITGWGFHGVAFRFPGSMPAMGYWVVHAVYDVAATLDMKLCTLIGADGSLNIGKVSVSNFGSSVTILKAGNPGRVVADTWYYVESGFKIATAGGAIIRLNAADPIVNPTLIDNDYVEYVGDTVQSTGTNAYPASTSQRYTHFRVSGNIGQGGGGSFVDVDDHYWCNDVDDGILPPTNTFLGNVRLGLIVPNGPGLDTDMSVVGSADPNWQVVSQLTPNDSIFVSGDTVGQRDMYAMEQIVGNPRNVFALLCNHRVSQDDAETRTYDKLITPPASGIPTVISSHTTPSGGFVNQQGVSQSNPDTSARWLASEVNDPDFEFGQEITA